MKELVKVVKKELKCAGSLRALGRLYKVSPYYVTQVLAGKKIPSAGFATKFGFERLIVFKKMR